VAEGVAEGPKGLASGGGTTDPGSDPRELERLHRLFLGMTTRLVAPGLGPVQNHHEAIRTHPGDIFHNALDDTSGVLAGQRMSDVRSSRPRMW
jgi:hypothetical protein